MYPSFQNKRYVIKVIIIYVLERKITDLKIRGVVCGVQFSVGTVYLLSFMSFARDSKWGCRNQLTNQLLSWCLMKRLLVDNFESLQSKFCNFLTLLKLSIFLKLLTCNYIFDPPCVSFLTCFF